MSYATDGLFVIGSDTLDSALSSLHQRAAYYQEAARLLRAVKSCGQGAGRIFNCAVVPAVSTAVGPRYAVHYGIRDYSARRPRALVICRLDEQGGHLAGPLNRWDFELADKTTPRLAVERLDKLISDYDQRAGEYLRDAAALPDRVAAYNLAAKYLHPIRGDVSRILATANIR